MGFKTYIRQLLPNQLVNYLLHLPQAVLANFYYNFPSKKLKIIGITGTSGKTSVAHLLYHLMNKADLKVALISTVSAKIGSQEIDTGLHVTNPGPFALQKLLKSIVHKHYTYVVLEVTSHGLDQFRTWGIQFDYGILTNITHEHLDYHKTFNNYRSAKLKLLKASKTAVINQNDPAYKLASQKAEKTLSFSGQGNFDLANQAAATAVAKDLGLTSTQIKKALVSFPGIPGRMEVVQTKPFTIIIDFAHKPDALEKALQYIRQQHQSGRIISVFGSAGLRDVLKRSLMGAISAKLSDITILTAEDPRTEPVDKIIKQIKSGFKKAKGKHLYCQPDRQLAINLAFSLARQGDVVVLFGKAHEKSICIGTTEHPWSEHLAVQKALFTAVVLAAGKGTRLKSTKHNKVVKTIAGKPMICYTADLLKKLQLNSVVMVVGFQKQSVKKVLPSEYIYAEQKNPSGTAHAVSTAMPFLPLHCQYLLVLNGDDSAFYQPKDIQKLINHHLKNNADMTLLTVDKKDPAQLGRIIRNKQNAIQAIVEFKNATEKQKKIKEVNTATYCFKRSFLTSCLPQVKKNPISKEYYLTDLLEIAIKKNRSVQAVKLTSSRNFQGINTQAELKSAQQKMLKRSS